MILALVHQGIKVDKRRATRTIRENGWLYECRRKHLGPAKVSIETQERENLIKQDFHFDKPYQKF
ncbi:hypothetical protein QU661_00940 [Mogibacterium neglectum]|uniref:hypothetical protein n=1 Tax=Mogibacterium neglectum TaxID=114528 RepID=UPI0027298163|nr:hypothetical protein [Mogibacterium neglectum]WLD76439.1 hypothetical protein QU661_00940 [Mogibacterium neglectum]